jgi:hypothetical protein
MAMYATRGALLNHSNRPNCWTLFERHTSGTQHVLPYYLPPCSRTTCHLAPVLLATLLPYYLPPCSPTTCHLAPLLLATLLPYYLPPCSFTPFSYSRTTFYLTSLPPDHLTTSPPYYLATYYLGASYTLLVRALARISPGDEITINYVDLVTPR